MKPSVFRTVVSLSVALNVLAMMGVTALVVKKGGLPWLKHQVPLITNMMRGRQAPREVPNTSPSVYQQLSVGPDDIILLGDDQLDAGEWHELLGDAHAKKRTIVGDDTHALLQRLGPIVEGRPRHVVVCCGSNNIRARTPHAQTAREYAQIVERLASRSPDTDTWLLPVLPVNARLYRRWVAPDVPYLHMPDRHDVQQLNQAIRALAVGTPRVHFVDLPEVVDEAGGLRQEYTLDGLHLNGAGLKLVALHLKRDLLRDSTGVAGPAPRP